MTYFFYNIFLFLGFFCYLPFYAYRKKIDLLSLRQKLGFLDFVSTRQTIWIQVVSVGEVKLIEGLVYRLREISDDPIVISTTTLTGNRLAKDKYGHLARIIYFPLDLSGIVKSIIRRINPKVFIAIETEIWPNVYKQLYSKSLPIIILNGRISDRAFKGYQRISWFMKKVLRQCSAIGVQNELYKQRFLALGALPSQIVVTGNMKFKSMIVDQGKMTAVKQRYQRHLKMNDRLVLLAASTHDPEEEMITDIYKDMLKTSDVVLLLAPRHPERVAALERMVEQKGLTSLRLSQVGEKNISQEKVIIVDTIGDLFYLCALCDICFMGGSFSHSGGHNILEPIYFLKPTIFGPSMENFSDIEAVVLGKEASIKVKDVYELKRVLQGLIENQAMRQLLSSRCAGVFQEGQNVLRDNIDLLLRVLLEQGG